MGEDVKESGSARTGSAKWTLDLFGRTLAMPRRRQLASIACWLFAGVSLMTILMGGVSYFDDWLSDRFRDFADALSFSLTFNLAVAFLAVTGVCVGAVLLGFANVARDEINPWPRRLGVILGTLSGVMFFLAYALRLTLYTWLGETNPSSVNFLWRDLQNDKPLALHYLTVVVIAAAGICAFIYALQLGAWLRSRVLTLVSALLFAALCVVTSGVVCLMVNGTAQWKGRGFLSELIADILDKSVCIGEMVVALFALVYFTVLAVRLGRKVSPVELPAKIGSGGENEISRGGEFARDPLKGAERTLDLYAPASRKLHRPRWAAAGCWILATGGLIGILARGIGVVMVFLPSGGPPSWATIQVVVTVYLLGLGVGAVGTIAILVGDVARGGIAKWPRWVLVVLAWTCCALEGVGTAWYMSLGDFRTWSPETRNLVTTIYVPLSIIAGALVTIVWVFAMVYALQLARWLGSKPLACTSALVFGALFLGGAADTGMGIYQWLHPYPSSVKWITRIAYGNMAWNVMAESCLIALLVVLAVRLGRAARRG